MDKKTVLHINGNYAGNQVHKIIAEKISDMGYFQHIYVPVRAKTLIGNNEIKKDNVSIKYDYALNKTDRLLYFKKIRKLTRRVKKLFDIEKLDHIHCHTLFSDGGVGYKLFKKYNIPYTLSIRNTDIGFFKYFKCLTPFAKKILINAKKIVVLTPTLRQKLYKNLDDDAIKIIDKKVVIIPNPIADFWFEHKLKEKKEDKNKVKLAQIGQLSKNKNNISVLKAINSMIKDKKQISYTIMGNGPIEDELKDYVKENKLEDYVNFTGYIKDKEKVQKYLLENDIFIMPSKSETFGLVYIEAMSQGLPVIYTKGQGIDGLFESQVGYGVDPEDIQGIIEAIGKIYNNYQILSKNAINQAKRLTASNIAKRYIDVWEQR